MTTTTTEEKPTRKFPPPCWTQEEALALIEAYRERWYALRRGYLRTADWDSVADDVGRRCPGASPAKTSAQCRHKMEKLRQRYRAEKQRSLSYPGRFFSSWFYFDSMDAMENGTSSAAAAGSNQEVLIDQTSVPLGFNLKGGKKSDGKFSNPNAGFGHEDVESGGGVRIKGVGDRNLVPLGFRLKNSSKIEGKFNPNYGYRGSNGHSSYLDAGSDEDADDGSQYGGGFDVKPSIDGNFMPPDFRAKKSGPGFRIKSPIDHLTPPAFKTRKFSKIEPNFDHDNGGYDAIDANGEYWVKVPNDRNSAPAGTRAKFSGKSDRNSNSDFDIRVLNGFPSQPRSVSEKKSHNGAKRGRSPVEDMVSSIKLLGEGFVKMEKMKMEMAKEIEKMRMEMEMKRNELLLESQQQIVDAFVKGLFENKKAKTTVSPDS